MTEGWIAALVALGVACAFVVGTLIYVGVSYLAMRGHVPARAAGATLREMARETATALVVQPLLPLYYFVGRRLGGRASGVPIVMVHGYFQNRVDFIGIARALRRAGLGPIFGFNYPWMLRVHANAERLARFAERLHRETGATEVDLVCHSMGGLVAIEAMRSHGLVVRRCVTIATPHAGVLWRGPILGGSGIDLRAGSELVTSHADYRAGAKLLSLASTHDNVVHPDARTALAGRGGEDVIVGAMGHLAILFARSTADAVVAFLAD
ncbi:MAG TPA: alpha/beta fold hydrolase [Polyangiaceae bacterium]|nr:alpha/beta fold hydrolase [Polyangiaceae bacterium]